MCLGTSLIALAQQLTIKYESTGEAYVVSGFMNIENDNDLMITDADNQTNKLRFAYYGADQENKSMQMMVSFTENEKREIPAGSMVIIKLGNGEIIGSRTVSNSPSAYKDQNLYSSNFHVFFDHRTARKIADNGVIKVRLAYDKKKFDWNADIDESRMLALGVFNTNLDALQKK